MCNMNHLRPLAEVIFPVKYEHMHFSIIFLFRILRVLVGSALGMGHDVLMGRFLIELPECSDMSFATQMLLSFTH